MSEFLEPLCSPMCSWVCIYECAHELQYKPFIKHTLSGDAFQKSFLELSEDFGKLETAFFFAKKAKLLFL